MTPLLLMTFVACDKHPPRAVIIVCDGTGHAPEAACTRALLTTYLRERSQDLRFLPTSAVVVVTSAQTYGAAIVTPVATVPATLQPVSEGQDAAWVAAGLETIGKIEIPDDRKDPSANKSDLLGAVSRATAEAENYVGFDRELVVASDGMFRSLGLNLESDAVTAKAARRAVATSMLPWDLSGFTQITLCGWHGVGLTPQQVTRRRETWTDLIELGQGPTPTVLTTCDALVGRRQP